MHELHSLTKIFLIFFFITAIIIYLENDQLLFLFAGLGIGSCIFLTFDYMDWSKRGKAE